MAQRVHFIDRLRVLAVLLLMPFHSARIFDQWEPFYAKNSVTDATLSWFIAVVGFWHMPLLFMLAGASSWFALRKRNGRQYLGERAKRLLVPLVFGTLVVVPPQAWFGAMTNTGYSGSLTEFWPSFYLPQGDLTGYYGTFTPAHLWFILFLFLLSAVALPLFLHFKRQGDGFRGRVAGMSPAALLLLPMLGLMVSDAMPEIGGQNFFFYLVYFLAGFAFAAAPTLAERLDLNAPRLLLVALALCLLTIVGTPFADSLPDLHPLALGHDIARLATGWLGVLAILGLGKRYLDYGGPLLAYAAEASYPFYVLHQTVIVAIGFYLVQLSWHPLIEWELVVDASLLVTLAIYEVAVRRWNPMRFLFGMAPRRKLAAVPAPSGRS